MYLLNRYIWKKVAATMWLASIVQSPVFAQDVCEWTNGNASLYNIPDIPGDVMDAAARYQNYRGMRFHDWLADGSLLVTANFGDTEQVYRIAEPLGEQSPLTFFTDPVADVAAIPGTSHFVVARDTHGDEWFQLDSVNLLGRPSRLSEPGTRNISPVFSSDSTLMAWARSEPDSDRYSIMVANPFSGFSRRSVFQQRGTILPTDISPDGTTVLFQRYHSNRDHELFLLDTGIGTVTQIAPTRQLVIDEQAQFARNGRSILVVSNRDSQYRRLIEFDAATHRMRVLSPPLRWDVERFAVSDDASRLAFIVNENGYSRLHIRDLATNAELPRPRLPDGVVTGLGFSPDSGQLAISLETPRSAGDVWVWDVEEGELLQWTRPDLGSLDPFRMAIPRHIQVASFDGVEIPALVYRPRTVPESQKTPVIIQLAGGPASQARPGWNPVAQYFAEILGATVILPNIRGSDGYGRRYRDLDNGLTREDAVLDIGSLLDWIDRRPGLDPDRVAIVGEGYGGYLALTAMAFYSERLVGGVNLSGISDFRTYFRDTRPYRRNDDRGEFGDERDPEMAASLDRMAPLNNARRISVPVLIMHGANDARIPLSQSEQIVESLRENGNMVWFAILSDEGQRIQRRPNGTLRLAIETVFLRALFGGNRTLLTSASTDCPGATSPPSTTTNADSLAQSG